MTGPTPATPEGSGSRPDNNTQACSMEQIQNHIATLKALIQQYNVSGETPIDPIQLDFEVAGSHDVEAQKALRRKDG